MANNRRNNTSELEIEHYLHCVLQKDRILIFQAKSRRRNKAPIYGYYVTVDVINCIRQKAMVYLERASLHRLMNAIWNLCKMVGRDDLMRHMNLSKLRGNARHINICIPCARVKMEEES